MKSKLFYRDAYMRDFSSKIVNQEVEEDGRVFVVLEETAFYPTGGGQPHDVGTLNGIQVVDVEEIDGEIRHYVKTPLSGAADEVHGLIDWEMRFDHMQQHAGQHILSAAFESLFNMKTLSFHLGKEVLTIDLDVDQLTEEDAWKAEELANQIILENRPIESKWVMERELENYHLRKQITVSENIRLVIIPEFDYNGCGGTHPNSTGQVAAIKILDWEKQKSNTRLRFICGSRVRKQFFKKHRILTQLSPLLNAPETNLVSAVRHQLDVVKNLEKELEATKETLLRYEASDCLKQSEDGVVAMKFTDRAIQELQKLARIVVAQNEHIIVIFVAENDGKLQFVCARGQSAGSDMKKCAGEALQKINGKGGGNESFAQGGGEILVTGEELLQLLKNSL